MTLATLSVSCCPSSTTAAFTPSAFTRAVLGGVLLLAGLTCRSAGSDPTVSDGSTIKRGTQPIPGVAAGCPEALIAARRGGDAVGRYVAPTADQRQGLRNVVTLFLQRGEAARGEAAAVARRIGFEIVDVPTVAGAIVLRDAGGNRGGGAYLLRLRSESRVVVQAPHTFFDEGTFPLACELFAASAARALFINTVHRYKGAPPDANGNHPADVAHAEGSMFQAATLGLLGGVIAPTVVQLHGFADEEGAARVIVSSGDGSSSAPLLERVQSALTELMGPGVLRYPADTTKLGATSNVQGAAVRAGGGRFLHVEMASVVRTTLLQDTVLRARFMSSLAPLLTPS